MTFRIGMMEVAPDIFSERSFERKWNFVDLRTQKKTTAYRPFLLIFNLAYSVDCLLIHVCFQVKFFIKTSIRDE